MSPQAFLNTFKVFSYISSENSESLQKIWLKAVVWNLSSPPVFDSQTKLFFVKCQMFGSTCLSGLV